jgi:hypothetical protein
LTRLVLGGQLYRAFLFCSARIPWRRTPAYFDPTVNDDDNKINNISIQNNNISASPKKISVDNFAPYLVSVRPSGFDVINQFFFVVAS